MDIDRLVLCRSIILGAVILLLMLIVVSHAYLISYYGYVCPDTNATLYGKLLDIERSLPGSPIVFPVSPYFRYVQSVPLYHEVLFVVDLRQFTGTIHLLTVLRTGYGVEDHLYVIVRGGCFYLFNTTPFMRTIYTFIAAIEYGPNLEKVIGLTQVVVTIPPVLKVTLNDIKDLTTGKTYTTPYVKLVPGHVYEVDLNIINLGELQARLNVTFYLSNNLKILSSRNIYVLSLPNSIQRVSVKFKVSKIIPRVEKAYVNVTLRDYSAGYLYFAGYLNLTVLPSTCKLVLERYSPKALGVDKTNDITVILRDLGGPCKIDNVTVRSSSSLKILKIWYSNKVVHNNQSLVIHVEAIPKTLGNFTMNISLLCSNPYYNFPEIFKYRLSFSSYSTLRVVIEIRNGTIIRSICARAENVKVCGEGYITLYKRSIVLSVPLQVRLSRYVRLVFSGWSNGLNNTEIKISESSPSTIVAYYSVEYYIKLTYPEGVLAEGWFKKGYNLSIQVPSKLDEGNGTVLLFDSWICEVGSLENVTSLTIHVTSPLICDAKYSRYYKVMIVVLVDGNIYEKFTRLVPPGSSLYINVKNYKPSDMWFLVSTLFEGWKTSTGESGKSETINIVVNQPMEIDILWSRSYLGLIGIGSCAGIAIAGILFRGKLKRATTVLVRSLRSRREEEIVEQPPSTMVYSEEGEVIPAREFTEVRTDVSTMVSEEKKEDKGSKEGGDTGDENPVS
ncbi:MAG: hypothetical protein GXO26_05260 [Crenarchaeota archaeon]|nr:hypothetical protein [Thermoproteota archaeon]